jgi:hypothetical protein
LIDDDPLFTTSMCINSLSEAVPRTLVSRPVNLH